MMATTPTPTMHALIKRLHHAPLLPETWGVFWTPNGDGGKKRSHWLRNDCNFAPPTEWALKSTFFGINPSAGRRADWECSTNETIGAVNAFFAEFDGKDFVTKGEWLPNYVAPDLDRVAADTLAELAPLGLDEKRLTQRIKGRQRGALVQAENAAIDATYKLTPDLYMARAWSHIEALPQRPTASWKSGGGYQCVWLLDETVYLVRADGTRDLAQFERMAALQKKWVAYVGGDSSASDLRRIFRWPGSINFKPKYAPNFPTVDLLYCDLGRTYALAALETLLPAPSGDPPPKQRARRTVHIPVGLPVDLGDLGDVPTLPRHPAIAALNHATDLGALLEGYGYTDAKRGRLSRPGGDSGGVALHANNTATIFSSADPLFCERRITPAHAMVVYEFGGDVDAFMATLPGVGAVKETLATKEQFETARRFIHSPQFVEPLRAGGIPRVAGPIACLDALLETATPTRTTKIKITMCDLGDMYSVSAMSAHRHIKRLTEVGIIHVELIDGCTTVDLSNLLDKSVTVQERVNYCNTFINITDEAFYREHRGDDAFTSYPYAYAIKRRECPTVLMQSLGANGLLLWAALAAGGTIKELAEATGLKVASVRYALKKFIQAGLVIVAHYGRAKEYLLCSNAEEMLEGIRPEMVTAGKGQLSAGKNASATASYAHRQLSGNAPLEPGKRAWLENRRDKCDAKASAIYASLESMGINPHAKVAHRTPRPNTLRFDAVEEWRSWGRDMWEVLELLGDCDMSEKIRLLTIAEVGDDASVETYRNARRAIAERAELALSLAPRRASLERTYNHPDVEEDTPLVTVAPQTLFAMSFIYA